MPCGWARVFTTSIVCGWQADETKNTPPGVGFTRAQSIIASAAAVPSSSREALAISKPVSSQTMVWKLSNASRRPWEISAW